MSLKFLLLIFLNLLYQNFIVVGSLLFIFQLGNAINNSFIFNLKTSLPSIKNQPPYYFVFLVFYRAYPMLVYRIVFLICQQINCFYTKSYEIDSTTSCPVFLFLLFRLFPSSNGMCLPNHQD